MTRHYTPSGDYCATGCSAPAVARIGNEALCAQCIDSMLGAPTKHPQPLSHGAVREAEQETK